MLREKLRPDVVVVGPKLKLEEAVSMPRSL